MTKCVWNIPTKNYQNLFIGFQVTVENVGDVFWGHSVVVVLRMIPYNATNYLRKKKKCRTHYENMVNQKATNVFNLPLKTVLPFCELNGFSVYVLSPNDKVTARLHDETNMKQT